MRCEWSAQVLHVHGGVVVHADAVGRPGLQEAAALVDAGAGEQAFEGEQGQGAAARESEQAAGDAIGGADVPVFFDGQQALQR